MTIASSAYLTPNANNRLAWGTELDASDSTPKEILGSVRWDIHPIWGLRGFEYVRFHDAAVVGSVNTQIANVGITNATGTSTGTVVTTGLTADIYTDCLVRCKDDTGGAGAAPEGELARIVGNTATTIYLDSNDYWSVAPSSGDDFEIICPSRVSACGAGDESLLVRGVAMTTHDAYDYGWVQFFGLAPHANVVAAGTTVTGPKGLITATGVFTVSSSSARNIIVGSLNTTSIATDQVKRTDLVFVKCGLMGEHLVSA